MLVAQIEWHIEIDPHLHGEQGASHGSETKHLDEISLLEPGLVGERHALGQSA